MKLECKAGPEGGESQQAIQLTDLHGPVDLNQYGEPAFSVIRITEIVPREGRYTIDVPAFGRMKVGGHIETASVVVRIEKLIEEAAEHDDHRRLLRDLRTLSELLRKVGY